LFTRIPFPRLIVAPGATPFAFVLAAIEVGVLPVPPEVLEVGISQPTKISAVAEDEIPNATAQNIAKCLSVDFIRIILLGDKLLANNMQLWSLK